MKLPEWPRRVTREKRDMFFKMSTPSKRVRKASTATVVLTPGDNDMIANFTNRFEKYFKLKNEILNSSANAVADFEFSSLILIIVFLLSDALYPRPSMT
jgi:hypothetical protein